jgi:hypothetical protein
MVELVCYWLFWAFFFSLAGIGGGSTVFPD